jgi:hypothetical protein
MHAGPGDQIVVDSLHAGDRSRKGEILEVRSADGVEHYIVRWDDGRETTFYPGSTAHTVTPTAPH